MAKFCGNCGAPLDDNARVCGNCGVPVAGAKAAPMPQVNTANPEKAQKLKKIVLAVVAVAVLAVVAVNAVKLVQQNTGYNALLRKTMNAYKKYDVETLAQLSSGAYDYYFNDSKDAYMEFAFKSKLDRDMDNFESDVGHNFTLSYEVQETYSYSKRKMDEFYDNMENRFPNYDAEEITQVVVAEVEVTAKQDKKSESRTLEVVMTKEDDGWKLFTLD